MKKIESMQNKQFRDLIEERKYLKSFLDRAGAEKNPVIDIETGRFLEFAVLIHDPVNILEIGCGSGFSSYFLIKNLNKSGSYTGIDLNRKRIRQAEDYLREIFPKKRLEFIEGNALDLLGGQKKSYDFVFIDAAKFEYYSYLKAVEPEITAGAIVIADNIFYRGKMFRSKTCKHDANSVAGLKKFLEYVTGNKKYRSFIMDVGDGLSVSIAEKPYQYHAEEIKNG